MDISEQGWFLGFQVWLLYLLWSLGEGEREREREREWEWEDIAWD